MPALSVLLATLAVLGLVGGFLSGLLGIGGSVFMIPLLLYVPPYVSALILSMKQVAGISMVEVAAASLSGLTVHWRHHTFSRSLAAYVGPGMVAGAFGGAVFSKYTTSNLLLAIFATIAIIAAAIMFVPPREEPEEIAPERVRFNRPLAAAAGLLVGTAGGMIGAPGGFILVPIMIYLLKIPIRVTISSSLGITFLGAVFGLAGKEITGQIDWPKAAALVAGAVPGAQLGGYLSERARTGSLRLLIGLIIAAAAIRIWYQVITGR